MKTYRYICVLLLFGLFSCQKDNEKDEEPEYDVHEFVLLIKEGQYDSWSLPKFCPNDIPILLEYASDFQEIPIFPRNPVSSYMPPTFRLGECLLWTIESIKKNYNTGHMFYPSNNPMLVKDGSEYDPREGVLNEQELFEVYELYANLWDSNRDNTFDNFRHVDVLENSGYFWM